MMALCAGITADALAQGGNRETSYPSRPIRAIVPFPPGGTPDIQIRMLAEKLTPRFGQQIVVDNRPGASGNIGMETLARSPADGYTLICATVGNYTVNPHLFKLSYDVLKDFAPIVHLATTPAALIVHPAVAATTVKELITIGQRRPGDLNYASSGPGGFGHMSMELFMTMTKTKFTHVPYKGVALALSEMVGGHTQVQFISAAVAVSHIKAGRVRAIATSGSTRAAILPDVPTVAEAGVPGYENTTWSTISAPARTPATIIDRLNREINAILEMADIRERFAGMGSTVTGGTPAQAYAILKSEFAKYGKLTVAAGVRQADGGSR
jgi:tripartite-type tricarboxylate transporter receptor subunit TctC